MCFTLILKEAEKLRESPDEPTARTVIKPHRSRMSLKLHNPDTLRQCLTVVSRNYWLKMTRINQSYSLIPHRMRTAGKFPLETLAPIFITAGDVSVYFINDVTCLSQTDHDA